MNYKSTAMAGALSLAFAALSGCATSKDSHSVEHRPSGQMADPSTVLLGEKGEEITSLLKELTALERSRQLAPEISNDPSLLLSPKDPLNAPVTLEWAGEASVVLKRVADVAGWRFATKGSAPFNAQIRVNAVDKPLINVLEDISSQLGSQADVGVNAPMKTIELLIRG